MSNFPMKFLDSSLLFTFQALGGVGRVVHTDFVPRFEVCNHPSENLKLVGLLDSNRVCSALKLDTPAKHFAMMNALRFCL